MVEQKIINMLMANAHEDIDKEIFKNDLNQLDPSSIERILHNSWGDNILALYSALTKGGEKRYIDRSLFGRLESPESLRDMDWGTRQTVLQNPNFADTLATADVPEYKQQMREMDVPLWKLLLKGILGR